MATEEMWFERVKEWRASGLSAGRFCAGKGYAEGTLRYWATRQKRATADGERTRADGQIRLARVVRAPAAPLEAGGPETPIVIEVGGARVSVRTGFDRRALGEVLSILGGGQ